MKPRGARVNKWLLLLLGALLSLCGRAHALEACWYPSRSQEGSSVREDPCALQRGDSVLLSEAVRHDLEHGRDGLSCVVLPDGSAFHVHRNGRSARTLLLDSGCDDFAAGLTRGLRNGRTVFLDRALQVVMDPGFEWVSSFRYGHAVVCNGPFRFVPSGEYQMRQGGRCGLVDRQGRLVLAANHHFEEWGVFQRYVDAHNHCAPPPVRTAAAALCHARRHVTEVHQNGGRWSRHRVVRRADQWLVGFVESGRPPQAFVLTLQAESGAYSSIRRVTPPEAMRLPVQSR